MKFAVLVNSRCLLRDARHVNSMLEIMPATNYANSLKTFPKNLKVDCHLVKDLSYNGQQFHN